VQQRRQPGSVDRFESDPLPVELALQHRELVPSREDLEVLAVVAARQQPQQRTVVMPVVRRSLAVGPLTPVIGVALGFGLAPIAGCRWGTTVRDRKLPPVDADRLRIPATGTRRRAARSPSPGRPQGL
jgi:hypothetical protein